MNYKRVIKSYSRFEKYFSIFLIAVALSAGVSIAYKANPEGVKEITNANKVTYSEALHGSVQKLNPVYTSFNGVDQDISRLLFCSLSAYDPLTGQIEESVATHILDETQTIYQFSVKENVHWHDGTPVSAEDIMFTYKSVIQNEAFENHIIKDTFQNVEIKLVDENTVQFMLQSPNSFFFSSTIIGLLPFHILKDVPVEELPNHEFNSKPIGCGPYQFDSISKEGTTTQVRLSQFEDYFEKKGNIEEVIFTVYPDFKSKFESLNTVHGMSRIPTYLASEIEDDRFNQNEYTLPQYTALFFNTDAPLLKDRLTRLGIKKGIQREAIINVIGHAKIVDTPLLQLNQGDWINKANVQEAMGALFDAGWKLDHEKGIRTNEDGEVFELKLVSRLYEENSKAEEITTKVLQSVKQQLNAIGVTLNIERLPLSELEQVIIDRDYDIILYGQSLGYNLDTYSFWHSSQTGKNGLNLSEYANPKADSLIEKVRVDFDMDSKTQKLEQLAQILSDDVPAVFLYTPTYYFLTDSRIKGVEIPSLATPTDRLNHLHYWVLDN